MSIIRMSQDARAYLKRTSVDYSQEAIAERDPAYKLPALEYGSTSQSDAPLYLTGRELLMSIRARLLRAAGVSAQEIMARLGR